MKVDLCCSHIRKVFPSNSKQFSLLTPLSRHFPYSRPKQVERFNNINATTPLHKQTVNRLDQKQKQFKKKKKKMLICLTSQGANLKPMHEYRRERINSFFFFYFNSANGRTYTVNRSCVPCTNKKKPSLCLALEITFRIHVHSQDFSFFRNTQLFRSPLETVRDLGCSTCLHHLQTVSITKQIIP